MIKEYFNRKEAADYLTNLGFKISAKTLAKYATVGGGPLFRKWGNRRAIYESEALRSWAFSKLSFPHYNTSQTEASEGVL